MDNILFKNGVEPTEVMRKTFDYASKMENSLKEQGKYPTITYQKQDKTTYDAEARVIINSFVGKDNKEIGEIQIRDGLQSARILVDKKGVGFSAKISAYSPKNKSFYEPKNVSEKLQVFVDYVENNRANKKTYDTPYVQKEAFDSYVAVKKYVRENSPVVEMDDGKHTYYVGEIKDNSFTNDKGDKVNMYQFDIKGRSDELVKVTINSHGNFTRAEIADFSVKDNPVFTRIEGSEDLMKMKDTGLAKIVNESVALLPEREERETEKTNEAEIDEPEVEEPELE